jgi:hypothetical protein
MHVALMAWMKQPPAYLNGVEVMSRIILVEQHAPPAEKGGSVVAEIFCVFVSSLRGVTAHNVIHTRTLDEIAKATGDPHASISARRRHTASGLWEYRMRAGVGTPREAGYGPLSSLKALASYSGLSVRTLRDCLTDSIQPLPHFRVGGKILVRRSDFDTWVTQFRVAVKPTSVDAIVDDVMTSLR